MDNFFCRGKTHNYAKNLHTDVITWEEIISCFDLNIQNKNYIKILENFGIVLHEINSVKKIFPILTEIIDKNPSQKYSAHAYISFSAESKTFGKHKDQSDVWFWQCIGNTKWIVYDTEINVYTLSPGDIIYIPREMYHDTIPLSPRLGISFGVDS